jgi:hypothetical protein
VLREVAATFGDPSYHAKVSFVRADAFSVVIRDDCSRGCPSLTNDVEAVVAAWAPRLGSRRLFYLDSTGAMDEIVIVDGRFHSFAPGPMNPSDIACGYTREAFVGRTDGTA